MLKEIQKIIKQSKLDALLVTTPTNVQYLSHFTGSNKTLLISANKAYLFTDTRYTLRAKHEVPQKSGITLVILDKKKHRANYLEKFNRIGFEAGNVTYTQLKALKKECRGITLTPTQNIIENIRTTKQSHEIQRIKKSCAILDKVFKNLKKEIHIGIREQDLAWKVRELAYKEGAEDIAFEPIIAFGKNAALPHHKSADAKLKKSDLILIDIGVKYHGYCSDMTRVILPENPSAKLIHMYDACLEAKEAAEKKVRANIKAATVDQAARNVLKKHKLDKYFTHSLGHGVGIDIHEHPSLSPVSKDRLPENSVFTIEPGIYVDNFTGIRLEDTYLLQNGKAIALTKTPMSQKL